MLPNRLKTKQKNKLQKNRESLIRKRLKTPRNVEIRKTERKRKETLISKLPLFFLKYRLSRKLSIR